MSVWHDNRNYRDNSLAMKLYHANKVSYPNLSNTMTFIGATGYVVGLNDMLLNGVLVGFLGKTKRHVIKMLFDEIEREMDSL